MVFVLFRNLHLAFSTSRCARRKPVNTLGMDSDEGYNYEYDDEDECSEDSGEVEPEDDTLDIGEVELVDPVVAGGERDEGGETGVGGHGPGEEEEEDYRFEVLTAEQILQHMVECIREVNEVIQVGILVYHRQERPGSRILSSVYRPRTLAYRLAL